MQFPRLLGLMVATVLIIVIALPVSAQDTSATAQPNNGNNGTITIDTEKAAASFVNLADDAATGFGQLFNNFINQLYNAPQSDLVRLLMIIGGVILLLVGWRIYNWIILIAGILIGASAAVALVGDTNTVLMIAALLIGAVIGGFIAVAAYYVAVFFIGAYVGLLLTGAVATSLNLTPVATWILVAAAIIGGIILIALSFELLVVLASIVGANLIVIALNLQPQAVWLIGLTLLGVIVQTFIARRFGYQIRRRPARNPLRRT